MKCKITILRKYFAAKLYIFTISYNDTKILSLEENNLLFIAVIVEYAKEL